MNIAKPPDLLHLYLDFGKHTAQYADTGDAETNDNFYQPEVLELQDTNSRLVSVNFITTVNNPKTHLLVDALVMFYPPLLLESSGVTHIRKMVYPSPSNYVQYLLYGSGPT